jgi:hypothetical protein
MDPAADDHGLSAGCTKLLEKLSQQVGHHIKSRTAPANNSNTASAPSGLFASEIMMFWIAPAS